jgi:5'-nucleotidase
MGLLRGVTAGALAAVLAGCASISSSRGDVALRIVAINDFHGNLKSPAPIRVADPANPEKLLLVQAGGAAYLASAVAAARKGRDNTVVVAAGDLVSASPLVSSLFLDEPAVDVLGEVGLEIASVGNHEFDRGRSELSRLVHGGCAKEGCVTGQPFPGARFKYLAANVIDEPSGKPFLPAYEIRRFGGILVAFIGLTLKGTPAIVSRSGIAGLRFADEADTVNALVPELKRQGVEAIVVLIHEGAVLSGAFNERYADASCPGFQGTIIDLIKRFDKAVDLVVSGHTHRAYACRVDGRLVTSAGDYGRFVTEIDLVLDATTRDVKSADARNVIVDATVFTADAKVAALVEHYEELAAPKANRVVGNVDGELMPLANEAGESSLGNVIADAQLLATRAAGADIAFMNAGGIRAPLASKRSDKGVTYSDIFTVQPFGNTMVTMTLTGEQIKSLLEQQFGSDIAQRPRLMQVSSTIAYTWDAAAPQGSRVKEVSVKGEPLRAEKAYRVTVNSFMADGGDGLGILRSGVDREGGALDLDALEAYLRTAGTVKAPALTRIKRLN